MLFNSLEFVLFLPVVLCLYFLARNDYRIQNFILIGASYFFYGWWDVRFLFLIIVTTVVDYNTALLVGGGQSRVRQRLGSIAFLLMACISFVLIDWSGGQLLNIDLVSVSALSTTMLLGLIILFAPDLLRRLEPSVRKKVVLAFSIIVNLTILGFFKYFDFFVESFSDIYSVLFGSRPSYITLSIVLPVGISFYTFQSMSYTIDVYRGNIKPTNNFFDFAAYLSFFPQLVAGPIERATHLLPQFQKPRVFTKDEYYCGIWLIAWGLFKKVVIADNLAIIVNSTFGSYDSGETSIIPNSALALIAIYAFAFQIYADFSGYSDIARGCAKLFGFDLMINFRLPYIATNPSDFWLRWHISLSSWLRDYLYIALGGNRKGKVNTYRNLMLTMLIGGLWHGANWNFVLWGAYQGGILVLYRFLGVENAGQKSSRIIRWINIFWMFQLTCIGWLIFRAQNVDTIWLFLKSIFRGIEWVPLASEQALTILFYITPLLLFQTLQAYTKTLFPLPRLHWFVNLHIWFFIIMSIFALRNKQISEFIYFAF